FFDDVGDALTLELRVGADEETLGAWQPVLPRPRRRAGMLLVGSDINLLLACGSRAQHLPAAVDEAGAEKPERPDATAPYQLTRDLVRFRLRATGAQAGACYQWKLRATSPEGVSEDLLLAPVDTLS